MPEPRTTPALARPCLEFFFLGGQQNSWFPSFQLWEELHYQSCLQIWRREWGKLYAKGQSMMVVHCISAVMGGSKTANKSCWFTWMVWPTEQQQNQSIQFALQTNNNITTWHIFKYEVWCYKHSVVQRLNWQGISDTWQSEEFNHRHKETSGNWSSSASYIVPG